jgi:hypothetical protein
MKTGRSMVVPNTYLRAFVQTIADTGRHLSVIDRVILHQIRIRIAGIAQFNAGQRMELLPRVLRIASHTVCLPVMHTVPIPSRPSAHRQSCYDGPGCRNKRARIRHSSRRGWMLGAARAPNWSDSTERSSNPSTPRRPSGRFLGPSISPACRPRRPPPASSTSRHGLRGSPNRVASREHPLRRSPRPSDFLGPTGDHGRIPKTPAAILITPGFYSK